MLPRRELTVGKGYVNEEMWLVREVIEVGRKTVKYNTYHLSTGQLCGASHECNKNRFIHWADREATEEEIENLQHAEVDALYILDPASYTWEPERRAEQTLFHNMINR
jgi:hypothetical protein